MQSSRSHSIREAQPNEASALSELAFRSKAHWGYSPAFMEACRDELTIKPSQLGTENYQCFVAVDGDLILGYYSLEDQTQGVYELDALFVDPPYIGAGVGRSLIQHALQNLAERGAMRLIIQGDPHAVSFYEAAGAEQIGTRPSGSMPGRDLPLFEIAIRN